MAAGLAAFLNIALFLASRMAKTNDTAMTLAARICEKRWFVNTTNGAPTAMGAAMKRPAPMVQGRERGSRSLMMMEMKMASARTKKRDTTEPSLMDSKRVMSKESERIDGNRELKRRDVGDCARNWYRIERWNTDRDR